MKPMWNPVGDWVAGVADDATTNLANDIVEAMSQMVTHLATFWVEMPTINLTTDDGITPSPVVLFLDSELTYWTLVLAVLSVIIGGTRMIWEQRGAPLQDLLRSLLTLTLVTGLGVGVISILVVAADALSASIINRSTDGQGFAEAMKILLVMDEHGIAVFTLIILGLVGLIASLVQIVLMVVRTGMLVILAGILPTTAAFTNMEMGKQWFQRAVGWTIAFILYKPAAAVVYAVAFKLMGASSASGLVGSITGFALMIVALLALPALLRFVTPMVGAVASGSGGGAGAVAGAVATGAVSLGLSGSGRGKATPTSGSQPTQAADGAQGTTGSSGKSGGNAKPTPASQGPAGTPGASPAKGASNTAGAAAAKTSAGAGTTGAKAASGAAGPAGLAVTVGAEVASKASQAAQKTAQDSTGEGPSGSS